MDGLTKFESHHWDQCRSHVLVKAEARSLEGTGLLTSLALGPSPRAAAPTPQGRWLHPNPGSQATMSVPLSSQAALK